MRSTLRTLYLGLLTLSGLTAMAQYSITAMGAVTPCSGASYPVRIFTYPGVLPMVDTIINTDANCNYSFTFHPTASSGGIVVQPSCDGGLTWGAGDSAAYTSAAIDTLVMSLSCGGGPANCQAAFSVQQAIASDSTLIPWQMTTTNQSTGSAPIISLWSMPDGSTSTAFDPTFTFTEPGVYGICLTISAGTCSSVVCDTVVVDSVGHISTQPVWFDCFGTIWGTNLPGTPCDDGNPVTTNDTWSANCVCEGNGGAIDCLGIAGGNNMPGTACTDSTFFGNITGTWSANCVCIADTITTGCQACFTTTQLAPFTALFTSCSTGGTAPFDILWDFAPGGALDGDSITQVYPGPGAYIACLNIIDANGNECHICDSVLVDATGMISILPGWIDCQGTMWGSALVGTPCDDGNPMTANDTWSSSCVCVGSSAVLDCLGIPGGPNVVGSLCTDSIGGLIYFGNWDANCICQPGTFFDCLGIAGGTDLPGTACTDTLGIAGTWDASCTCVPDSNTTTCNASFWVIQAYDSTATGAEPIPNEVWVWNLSSGGNGQYQFLWNFGDGTTSTDAYPTHVYTSDGPWNLCLTMASGLCTDIYCDSVSVDANGILNQLVIGGGDGNVVHEATTGTRSGGFTLNVIQQIPAGISENPAFAELKAWPNPVLNELNLSFNTSLSGSVPVTVIDPSGRTLIAERQQLTTGSNTFRISTSTLEPGLYMVRIGNDARSITQRFMKVR